VPPEHVLTRRGPGYRAPVKATPGRSIDPQHLLAPSVQHSA
jgi:hypothetical protein